MGVFGVVFQMRGQALDFLGNKRDLNLGRTRVFLVELVLFYYFLLGFSCQHWLNPSTYLDFMQCRPLLSLISMS